MVLLCLLFLQSGIGPGDLKTHGNEVLPSWVQANDLKNKARSAVEANPRSEMAQLALGFAYLAEKKPSKARDAFIMATWLVHDRPAAWYGLGLCYEQLGDAESARRFKARAHALSSEAANWKDIPKGKTLVKVLQVKPDQKEHPCVCCAEYGPESINCEAKVQADLQKRLKRELAPAQKLMVPKDFSFSDTLPESGIRFWHRAVDDAGRDYKAVHYDHGNSLVTADVNGDGHQDLYYVNQVGANELWLGDGKGHYRNGTKESGIGLSERISVAASFADIDNDGDPDLFVTTVRFGNVLFENDGKGHFTDITANAGLGQKAHSSGAVFFDYDRDGLLDLFVANVGVYTTDKRGFADYYIGVLDAFSGHLKPKRFERSRIYRNLGNNRFQDVSDKLNFQDTSFCGDALANDVDGDGWIDLYLLNMQGDDHFYRNMEGKGFKDATAQYFPKTAWGAMGAVWFDIDNDGAQDLMITDMHSDMSQKIKPHKERLKADMQWPDNFLQGGKDNLFGNALYWNTGKGFEEVSDLMGVENYWPWGVSAGDINADGFQDLFIASSMNHPFRYGPNTLLLNNQGQEFVEMAFSLGVEPRRVSAGPWFQVDCDGADKDVPDCKDRTGKHLIYAAYGSRASLLIDGDNDGDLDIYTLEFNSAPLVLTSNLAEKTSLNYLKVALQGTTSNRSGYGSRVTIKTKKGLQRHWYDGKSGYLGQSQMPIYFGLGDLKEIQSLEVLWPSGKSQVMTDVKANQLIKIVEAP